MLKCYLLYFFISFKLSAFPSSSIHACLSFLSSSYFFSTFPQWCAVSNPFRFLWLLSAGVSVCFSKWTEFTLASGCKTLCRTFSLYKCLSSSLFFLFSFSHFCNLWCLRRFLVSFLERDRTLGQWIAGSLAASPSQSKEMRLLSTVYKPWWRLVIKIFSSKYSQTTSLIINSI